MLAGRGSIKHRLALLIVVFACGFTAIFAYGLWALRGIDRAAHQMADGKDIVADILPPPLYLLEAHLLAHEITQIPVDDRPRVRNRLANLKRDYDERFVFWNNRQTELDPEVRSSLFGAQKSQGDAYWLKLENELVPAALAGEDTKMKASLEELRLLYQAHRDGVDQTVVHAVVWADKRSDELATTSQQSVLVFSAIALLSTVIGGALALVIGRGVVVPLEQLRRTVNQVEHNTDFTVQLQPNGPREVAQTAESFNRLLNVMRTALRQIHDNAGRVSAAALQLTNASRQVAASSTQQSESAASMAATVEEVTTSIQQLSSNAREADSASRSSGNLSQEGGSVIRRAAGEMTAMADTVRQVSSSIESLGQQSTQISSVVKVIKEVADQTNLLALNAAIEAARAGEQGRGFAVVADEVRKLAERTTRATDEIAGMIRGVQDSAREAVRSMSQAVEQAGGGVALAERAGDAIVQIENGVRQVHDLVDHITSGLSEQSTASLDIARHVEQVARMTESNSQTATATAHAAQQLENLSGQMMETISRFRI